MRYKKVLCICIFIIVLFSGCRLRLKEKNESSIDAVKSVENYLENSRKNAYVDTSSAYIDAVRMKVNQANNFKFFEPDILYMVPVGHDSTKSCVSLESGGNSPFSNTWNYAFVGVLYNGNGYNYMFIGEDQKTYGLGLINESVLLQKGTSFIYSSYNDNVAKEANINEKSSSILKKYYNSKTNSILNVNDLQDDILLKSVLCTNTPSNGNLTENIKKVIFVSECKY